MASLFSRLAPSGPSVDEHALALIPRPADAQHHPVDAVQDIAAQDVELRVLRAELERKELEAARLREQARDQDLELLAAAGTVGTLSAQTETSNDNRQALLAARAETLGNQLSVLQGRMEQKRHELAGKDREVMELKQAELAKRDQTIRQDGERTLLQRSKEKRDAEVAGLSFQAGQLERQCAMERWKEETQAKLHLENTDTALIKERREWVAESKSLEEESATFRTFIAQMESRCAHAVKQLGDVRKKEEDLRMEEKLCAVAGRLGQETADEQLREVMDTHQQLASQLGNGDLRRSQALSAGHQALSAHWQSHMELAAVTECLQEISRALAQPATSEAADAVDAAMQAFLQSARAFGEQLPPVVRLGANDYLIGGELMQCALVGGVLSARVAGGVLMPMGEFMGALGPANGRRPTPPPVLPAPPLPAPAGLASAPPLGPPLALPPQLAAV